MRERILRAQFDDGKFSDEDEALLAELSVEHPDQCFQRYQLLLQIYGIWERGGIGKGVTREEEVEATRWLMLSREPVHVRIANRTVNVTSRSRAAMIRLQRHDDRRALLGEKLDVIAEKLAAVDAERRAGAIGIFASLRKKAKLHALRGRIEAEWEVHFRGILANALSEDGGAAKPEDVPAWWTAVTLEDEARLLAALIEAGPGRMERGTKPKRGASSSKGEPMTFGQLLRYYEPKLNLPPMALENADLAQFITALEDGASEGTQAKELEEALT